MRAKKYIQMPEHATFPLEKAFKTVCCDCGLVHDWTLVDRDGRFEFDVNRDNRATARIRKQNAPADLPAVAGKVRRDVGLCQWRGNKPCHEQATHDLVPKHGTPSRMCEKHYNWLKFLEANKDVSK